MRVATTVLRTDLAVAALDGQVEDRGDHVAVRTVDQPDFYWGNYLAISPTDDPAAAVAWLARAAEAGRPSGHAALALDGVIDAAVAAALVAAGATVETLIAMTSDAPVLASAPPDLALRPLDRDADWDALLALSLTVDPDTPALRRFLTRRIAARARAAARGEVRWWGAFADPTLVASAGMVPLPGLGRFQDVQTHPDWRRRGAASAVLAALADEQRRAGRTRLVLVVGEDNPPARAAYRRLGFVDGDRATTALRAPAQT